VPGTQAGVKVGAIGGTKQPGKRGVHTEITEKTKPRRATEEVFLRFARRGGIAFLDGRGPPGCPPFPAQAGEEPQKNVPLGFDAQQNLPD